MAPGPVCPFLTSCEAMEFTDMGHRREERPDLPVSLLMMLHALWLEYEKSMELTASSHRSCRVEAIGVARGDNGVMPPKIFRTFSYFVL